MQVEDPSLFRILTSLFLSFCKAPRACFENIQMDIDIAYCPNAVHGKFGLLSQGKARSHSTALPSLSPPVCIPPPPPPPPCVQCFSVSIHKLWGLLFYEGSLTSAQSWVRANSHTHEGGSGKNKPVQELTQRGRKNCPLPCLPRVQGIEPRIFGFQFRHSKSNH